MKRISMVAAAVLSVGVLVSLGFMWPFGDGKHELKLPGIVEIHEVRIGSKVGGRVGEIMVREGQEVSADAELVRFDAPELEAQRKQLVSRLAAARAELKKAETGPLPQERAESKAALDAANARIDKVRIGWRKELKTQAEEELKIANADWELAKENYQRVEAIRKDASKSEYDTARTNWVTAGGRLAAAKAKMEMVTKGGWEYEIIEAQSETARADARHRLLIEATPREEDKEIARQHVAELEAKLEEIKANLAEAVVKAPSRMIVEVLGVRKGDLVPPNTPIVRGMHLDDRWVKVFVPSTQLGKLRHGQAVEVTCDAYPGKRFPGKIIQIATISEFTPRNVQTLEEREHQVFGVKVQVEDEGLVFKPGMAAEVLAPLEK